MGKGHPGDWDQGRVIPKIATHARSGCSVAIWPLFRFDASELDYLGSFVDFGGDEVFELGRRHCSRLDAKHDEFRLQLGINDSCANCIVSILTISTGVALGAPIPNEPVAS